MTFKEKVLRCWDILRMNPSDECVFVIAESTEDLVSQLLYAATCLSGRRCVMTQGNKFTRGPKKKGKK